MISNKMFNILAAGTLFLSSVLCAQAADNVSVKTQQIMRQLEKQMARASLDRNADAVVFPMVQTRWKVVKTKTFSRRKVSVTMEWGKAQEVETVCSGIEKDGKLYVPQSCYYPPRKSQQNIQWLGNTLLADGAVTQLAQAQDMQNGWVRFILSETVVSKK